jgi:hypothetical protein
MNLVRTWRRQVLGASLVALLIPVAIIATLVVLAIGGGLAKIADLGQVFTGPSVPGGGSGGAGSAPIPAAALGRLAASAPLPDGSALAARVLRGSPLIIGSGTSDFSSRTVALTLSGLGAAAAGGGRSKPAGQTGRTVGSSTPRTPRRSLGPIRVTFVVHRPPVPARPLPITITAAPVAATPVTVTPVVVNHPAVAPVAPAAPAPSAPTSTASPTPPPLPASGRGNAGANGNAGGHGNGGGHGEGNAGGHGEGNAGGHGDGNPSGGAVRAASTGPTAGGDRNGNGRPTDPAAGSGPGNHGTGQPSSQVQTNTTYAPTAPPPAPAFQNGPGHGNGDGNPGAGGRGGEGSGPGQGTGPGQGGGPGHGGGGGPGRGGSGPGHGGSGPGHGDGGGPGHGGG